MGTQKKKKGLLKSEARKKEERVLRRLGFTPHSSGALRGDVRDAATVKRLLQDAAKIPEFLTVPISDWYAPPPLPPRSARQIPRVRFLFVVALFWGIRRRASRARVRTTTDVVVTGKKPSASRVRCFLPLTDTSCDASPGMRR